MKKNKLPNRNRVRRELELLNIYSANDIDDLLSDIDDWFNRIELTHIAPCRCYVVGTLTLVVSKDRTIVLKPMALASILSFLTEHACPLVESNLSIDGEIANTIMSAEEQRAQQRLIFGIGDHVTNSEIDSMFNDFIMPSSMGSIARYSDDMRHVGEENNGN